MNEIINSDRISINNQNCGGKATGLLFLKKHHFNVPPFFLIDHETVQHFIKDEGFMQNAINQFIEIHKILPVKLWAIRSSANVEDSQEFSYAGLFRTITNVNCNDIATAIKTIVDSYLAVTNLNYGAKSGITFSIIIQEMINPDYSGVIFTQNPLNHQDNSIIINILPGLGENLVSGKEEALIGTYKNRKINWSKPEQTYHGEFFSGSLTSISKTGYQIIDENKTLFKRLIKDSKKLAKLKNYAVDIEFAVAGNKIYWLQVRPITSMINEKPTWIYDNSNIGENYPGITLPLSISFVKHSYSKAYKAMAKYLGMSRQKMKDNELLFTNMVGDIKAALYYNITAWQQLLYQLPFGKKTSKHITKLLGMEDAEFQIPKGKPSIIGYFVLLFRIIWAFIILGKHRKLYLDNCESTLSSIEIMKLSSKTHSELIEYYKKLENNLGENWLSPVLNGFYAMISFSLLKKIIHKSKLNVEYPNFINDILYSQGDIISVQIVREFKNIVTELQQNEDLKKIFLDKNEKEIYLEIEKEFPDYYSKITKYINQFGERCDQGELKMEIVNYKEDPLRFIALLKTMAQNPYHASETHIIPDYKHVIKSNYRFLKRFLLLKLIKITLNRIRDRENFRFTRTKIFSMIRLIFRAIDKDLLQNKYIGNKGDSLYLKLEEILNPELADNYSNLILMRRMEYTTFETEVRSNRYKIIGDSIIPEQTELKKNIEGNIKGIGCCSGVVTNKVVIITPESIKENNFAGCILVAKYFEPGWINIFGQAAGVISEKGNLLSHTAILCREMGIPSIVGAKGIAGIVKNGDIISMNGATGEIKIETHGE